MEFAASKHLHRDKRANNERDQADGNKTDKPGTSK